MEHLLEEVSFEAGESAAEEVKIDDEFVQTRLATLTEDDDARKYLL
jgi:ATP-dependent protease HslVU (ClpYQ) ATPase subunit